MAGVRRTVKNATVAFEGDTLTIRPEENKQEAA